MSGQRAILAVWRDALRDSDLDTTAKCVGFVLSTYFRGNGRGAFPSKELLAAGAGLSTNSVKAVYNATRRLEAAGLLIIEPSKGRSSTGYTPAIPVQPCPPIPGTGEHGSAGNHVPDDSQPGTTVPLTEYPGTHKGGESVESGDASTVAAAHAAPIEPDYVDHCAKCDRALRNSVLATNNGFCTDCRPPDALEVVA